MLTIEEFFEQKVPPLPFRLAVRPTLPINVAIFNRTIDLAECFLSFPFRLPPALESFFCKISDINSQRSPDPNYQYDAETQAILDSDGYQHFMFYLTVYTNSLDLLLIEATPDYLTKLGIPLEESVVVEYYPCMYDPISLRNPLSTALGGDIKKLMLYCRLMHEHFLQLSLSTGELRLSAADILGQVSHTDPLPESPKMINLRYRRDVSHLVRSVF